LSATITKVIVRGRIRLEARIEWQIPSATNSIKRAEVNAGSTTVGINDEVESPCPASRILAGRYCGLLI
jgi:hypothetical protein